MDFKKIIITIISVLLGLLVSFAIVSGVALLIAWLFGVTPSIKKLLGVWLLIAIFTNLIKR